MWFIVSAVGSCPTVPVEEGINGPNVSHTVVGGYSRGGVDEQSACFLMLMAACMQLLMYPPLQTLDCCGCMLTLRCMRVAPTGAGGMHAAALHSVGACVRVSAVTQCGRLVGSSHNACVTRAAACGSGLGRHTAWCSTTRAWLCVCVSLRASRALCPCSVGMG